MIGGGAQLRLPIPLSDGEVCEEGIAALADGRRATSAALERLSETDAYVDVLLHVLKENGWCVHTPIALAGDGFMFIATCEWREARGSGETVGQAVAALVRDASTFYGVRQKRTA